MIQLALATTMLLAASDMVPIEIQFAAHVNGKPLACGQSYSGVGITKSTITPRDFRFYIHDVRLIDDSGNEVPLTLKQDEKWQLDNLALLDFENATGACSNGTPELNTKITGAIPAGKSFTGLRFTLGVPFDKNHLDPLNAPSPLNLTALSWVWNAGRKFARLDFSSTGAPRGWAIHLGSTGCTPDDTKTTIPTSCANPNRVDVTLKQFNPATDVVVADLASLLADSDVDTTGKMMAGCMSGPSTPACGPLFRHLGLKDAPQDFFTAQKR
jgi:uncharacterized repeat protein (TIGR04052 family)